MLQFRWRSWVIFLILLVFFYLASTPVYSLDPGKELTQYIPRLYTTDHGLPQSTVRAIVQTNDGYIWMGTYEGLARFDGVRFEVYSKAEYPNIKNSAVHAIAKDRKGHLWIGTAGGLLHFDRRTFTNYTVKNGLVGDSVISLFWDRSGGLWVGTTVGLSCYRGGTFTTYEIEGNGNSRYHITAISEDDAGTLWVGTEGGGLFLSKGESPGNMTFTSYVDEDGQPGKIVWDICKDRDGNMWLGTTEGLLRYEKNTDAFYLYSQIDGVYGVDVRSIYQDQAGSIWFATCEGGLNRLSNGVFSNLPPDGPLAGCSYRYIFEDYEGSLWAGSTQCGVCQFKEEKFQYYGHRSGLPKSAVRSVREDGHGTMWIGTDGAGLVKIKNGRVQNRDSAGGVGNGRIWSIACGRDNSVWVGTYNNGLKHIEGNTVITYTTADGLSDNIIRAILADGKGNIWIGTNSGGVDVFRGGKVLRNYSTRNGLADNFIFALAEDDEGAVWVGTFSGGVHRIKDGAVTVYNSSTTKDFPNKAIWALYPDKDRSGALWMGTNGGGLFRMYKGKVDRFSTRDGLCADITFQILEDKSGYLWMNCNSGLYKVKKKDLEDFAAGKRERIRCRLYGKNEGIRDTEASGPAFPAGWSGSDGRLWFPTTKGVVVVDPDHIPMNRIRPPVVIEDVVANGKTYSPHTSITVPPGSGSMEIQYTATSFLLPQKVRFKYRLEGFQEQWVDVGARRTAYYTNLPPGEFTFRVIACNNDGLWNVVGDAVNITMQPHFWLTLWFRLLALLAVLFIIYLFLRLRTRSIEKQKHMLSELVTQQTQELKEAREKAEKARETAETANQSKSEFLARMSHEIRTPMNSVIGFTEMLMASPLNEEQKDFVNSISHSGEALLTVINDILDFSKIEAGQLDFESIDFDPEMTAFDVCESIMPRVESRGLEILCRIDNDVPALVNGDPGRFRQVLTNLMANAVKFTESGEIELSLMVEKRKKRENLVKLHVKVRDTGIGIPIDKIDSIFEDFRQADGSITRKFGGTGLGLAICRQIARLMGGDVWAVSEPGRGSTFHFTAWLKKSRKRHRKPVYSQFLSGKKLLVVDDNESNLDILEHILKSVDIRAVTLKDSQKTVSALQKAHQMGKPFDLCVIDAQMPNLDGCQLARRIRDLDHPVASVPLLAFSSTITRHSKLFRQSGFDGYLPKPVKKQKLYLMIGRLLGEKTERDIEINEKKYPIITQHSLAEEAKHSISILLAEDNPINRKLARYMLEKAGYRLNMVENGKEAVKIYTANPANYDLIFMDVQMPEMDGKEATRKIRELGFDEVPIIAMTAQTMKGDRERCLEAGMNDYISKPINREEVFKMVRKWCMDRE